MKRPVYPRSLRRRPAAARPAVPRAVATAMDRSMAIYADGVADGMALALDQLDGQGAFALVDGGFGPDGVYAGPMPPELVDWIARARRRLAEENAERHGPASGGDHGDD